MKEHLQKMWNVHESSPFPPGFRGKKIKDIDPTLLESQVAAAVMTALETNGVLGIRVNREFSEAEKQLSVVNKELTGEPLEYFKRLENIARELRKWVNNTKSEKQ